MSFGHNVIITVTGSIILNGHIVRVGK